MQIFFRILAGVIGGTVGGMGMGGGTLLIPILTIFLAFKQIKAQGINLIAFIPMSVVALIMHTKNHLVRYKETWLLCVFGAIVSFFSAMLANHIDNTILKKLFAVFLIILGIWQTVEVIKAIKKKHKAKKNKDK